MCGISRKLAYLIVTWLWIIPSSQAQLIHPPKIQWSAFEQYQAQAQLLQFDAYSKAQGSLLILPELTQAHTWLPVAHYWQQENWDVRLILPDAAQQQFDPSTEQPSPRQQLWLQQQLARLTELMPTAGASPQIVLVQGSAALWYQQWVDAGELPAPQALILFDALPQDLTQQNMLAISLARSPYPILDIYSRPNSLLAWHNQQRRQQQLRRREKTGYAVQHFYGTSILNKDIAGWLVRLGWLPLPPSAPAYLKEQHSETRLSRPDDAGTGR